MAQEKILIMSHGHPDLNKGGAEVAAYNMYKELEKRGEDVYFLARTSQTPHGGAAFSSRNTDREILFHTTMDDGFTFSNVKTRHLWQEFRDLLTLIKPTVVHLHHYFLFGIEIIKEIKNTLPDAKVVLTLHEYLAICHNKGLMYKTTGKLCYKASPRDCHGCFPEKQPGDFFFRERYIKSIFAGVDHFVSPSQFLKQRYIDWGLNADSISVIENGQQEVGTEVKGCNDTSSLTRFMFFGQINPFKGLDVLIKALQNMPKSELKKVAIEIYGANLEHQESEYKSKIKKLLKAVSKRVTFHGSYEPVEMPTLLKSADYVVVPSIWWENSPMVIQEAFNANVPLIVSNIGGMAEKVEDEVNGLHFRVGSAADLARVMQRCINENDLREKLVQNITKPLSIEACVDQHMEIYSA